jgi:hypothetical protein
VAAKVVGSINNPGAPEFMLYDAASDRIYLNVKSVDQVAVIDPTTDKIVVQWLTAPATQPHGAHWSRESVLMTALLGLSSCRFVKAYSAIDCCQTEARRNGPAYVKAISLRRCRAPMRCNSEGSRNPHESARARVPYPRETPQRMLCNLLEAARGFRGG